MPDDTTIANDSTRTLPQSHQPKPVRAKRPKPTKLPKQANAPRWPTIGRSGSSVRGSQYSRSAQPYVAPAAPKPYRAPRDHRVSHAVRRHLPRFHVIHVVLLAGVGALWLAIMQPWGTDAGDNPIFIQQFSIPRISDPSVDVGQVALQTATGIAMAAVVMAVALVLVNFIYTLLNKLLRRMGLSALAAVLFVPLIALLVVLLLSDLTLAAGFGGLSALSQLPFVRDHGFASIGVAHAAIGFYLWWVGIGITVIGTIGEVFIDHH
jgi:hypothetical protein